MPNNELQELLGARFERYTHSTNESVWTAIEAQLDEEKSNRIGFWFWIFNGLAATLLIGIMVESGMRTDLHSSTHISKATSLKEIGTEQTENSAKINDVKESSVENSSSNTLSSAGSSTENGSLDKGFANHLSTGSLSKEELKKEKIDQGKTEDDLIRKEQSTIEIAGFSADQNAEVKPEIASKKLLDVNSLSTRSISSNPTEKRAFKVLPKSLLLPKTPYFKRLPIHLGFEFSYLDKIRLSSKSTPVTSQSVDTSYAWTNDQLAKNRHFELSFLSQFDLTPRFSASIGFGYSRSQYTKDTSSVGLTSSLEPPKEANQRLFAVPIQAKYAFFRKNRFALSAGLTAQMEFGRNQYTESSFENSTTVTFPQPLTVESLIVTEQQIQQFALEPFMQLSIGLSPRFTAYANVGYRTYLWQKTTPISESSKTNFLLADFGLQFRIH